MFVILVAIAALAGLVSGCDILARDARAEHDRRPLGLPADARVLHWFHDDALLVASGGSLWLHDPERDEAIRSFPSPDPSLMFVEARCVTDDAAILVFGSPSTTLESGRGAPLAYRFTDWQDPARYAVLDRAVEWWGFNPLDCSTFDYGKEKQKTLLVEGRERNQETGFRKLLPSSQGITEVYEAEWRRSTGPGDRGTRRVAVALRGQDGYVLDRTLTLELPLHHADVIPRYDRKNDVYLWHMPTQKGFSARPEEWQLLTWRVSPDMSLEQAVALPAGPWVYRESFVKALSCFSCGCSCYEHLDARFEDDTVFLMVHGRAVKERHQGLYRLALASAGHSPWTPVALGNVDPLYAVSSDGCRVAYRQNEQVFVADTCGAPG